jgi:hypothetical protein
MKPTLVDQVGAMGVVDRLRFESHRVQDYMNTAAQKAQLVEKIAAGYAAEGTVVPVEIIQQGVDQWYQNRLVFKSTWIPWYLRMYIRRERWLKPVAAGFVVASLVIGGWFTASYIAHKQSLQQASEAILVAESTVLRTKLASSEYEVVAVPASETAHGFTAKINLELSRTSQAVATLEKQIQQEIDARSRDVKLAKVVDLSHLNKLVQQYQVATTSLREKRHFAATVNIVHAEVTALAERALAQLSVDEDKNQVNALASRILGDIDNLAPPTSGDIERLKYLEMLSRTPIRLVINPDNTQKSGVEREFSSSGGKAWYLIVQPVDASGLPVKLNIKSRETGREVYASIFGIRVNDALYEEVRKDKMADGIVNRNIIGFKPAGKLSFDLESGIFPEYILEW